MATTFEVRTRALGLFAARSHARKARANALTFVLGAVIQLDGHVPALDGLEEVLGEHGLVREVELEATEG